MTSRHFQINSLKLHGLPILFLLVFTGILFSQTQREVHKLNTEPGFALDDAWIHASMAHNLIRGRGYGLNEGHWLPLSTAPAWTLLLAFFLLLTGDPVIAGLTAALFCQTGAILLMYLLARRWTGNWFWSLVPAVLLTLNPVLLWGFASGMEHPLVTLSVVLCLYIFDVSKSNSPFRIYGLPLALVLGAMSRPELFVLTPLALLATVYQNLKTQPEDRMGALRVFATQCAVFLVGTLPYFLFNFLTIGHFFPTAFHVKAMLRDVGFFSALSSGDSQRALRYLTLKPYDELRDQFLVFLRFNFMLTLCVPLGLLSFFRPFRVREFGRSALLLSLVFLLPPVMGAVAPNDNLSNYAYRYLAPFIPGIVLLGSLGLWLLWSRCGQKTLTVLLFISAGYATHLSYGNILKMYARDVANTNALYVHAGQWIRDNLDPAIPVAVNDIGGISYFIDNPILDVMGLGSPEIWPVLKGTSVGGAITPKKAARIRAYLLSNGYEYLVISPRYYPDLHRESAVFEPIMTWPAVYPTGRAIDPQILYRIHHPAPPVKSGTSPDGRYAEAESE